MRLLPQHYMAIKENLNNRLLVEDLIKSRIEREKLFMEIAKQEIEFEEMWLIDEERLNDLKSEYKRHLLKHKALLEFLHNYRQMSDHIILSFKRALPDID